MGRSEPVRDQRPSPEALLVATHREGRGRLKIFLGAAPGVGKTFEMLLEAQAQFGFGEQETANHCATERRVLLAAFAKSE